jgi:FAD/FMN-containing dehydrogenase
LVVVSEKTQTNNSKIYERLVAIVGSRYVSNSEDVLYTYSEDFITFEEPGKADFVVMPKTTEEVQAIMRLANRERIPVVPWVANLSVGALATPREGGIVLDMRRMNQVLEVNEEDQYILVEGGITYADVVGYVNRHYPHLRIPVTYAPPATGYVASSLMYGMTDLSMAYGDASYFVNAFEAVLPTGEIIRTGSAMSSPHWNHHAALPDFGLIGLFIGWAGTTGVVTKASIKLYPKRPYRADYFMDADTVERGFKIQRDLARTGIIDDIASNNWAWGRVEAGEKLPFTEGRRPGEPELSSWVSFTANTEKELEAKTEIVKNITEKGGGKLTLFEEGIKTFTKGDQIKYFKYLPVQLSNDISGARGGRAQWVGGYAPPSKNAEIYRAVEKIYEKYGYTQAGHPIQAYNRLMDHGHEGIIRYNIFGSKDDTPETVERHRKCLREIGETMRAHGTILYKAPPYFARLNWLGTDPAAMSIIRSIKRMLDPNRIMNPGQLDF